MADWISDDLRSWRKRLRLTQAEAADKLDVSLRTYSDRETKNSKIPVECALACIALEMGFDLEDSEMLGNSWVKVGADRIAQVRPGHLVLVDERDGAKFAITTTLSDSDDDPAVVYLSSLPTADREYNVDVIDHTNAIDFGDNWEALASAKATDFHFPTGPGDYPLGSLLLSEEGPVAIALRPVRGRARFYMLDTKKVVPNDPRADAVATKWAIRIRSRADSQPIVVVRAAK